MTMYQDSKRIVALQADISKNIVTINHRCSTTDDHAYADLGSALSNTSWVMRYKMVISGLSSSSSNPNNSYLFAISKTNANNMVDQSLGLKMRIGGGTGYLDFHVSGGTSSQNGGEGYDGSLFSSTTVANGTLYVECIRNGSSFSIRLTTSSDYTGGELDTWSTSGTVEDLRYIKYTNRDDNTSSHVCVSTISDIKIYDGVTSATGTFVRDGTWTASASNKVTVALESNKPTNVQDNSLLVEKDTARRYWFDAESDITPTDLNTPTWTKSTSDLSQTTDYLQWANMTGGTENGYYDIGSGNVSDTKWVLRATLTVSSYSTGTAAHSRWCGLGLSSSSATLTGSQDSINIILRTNTSSDTIAGTRSNGTAVDSQLGTAGISGVTLGNGTFYLEMIRESDSDYKLYVRSGSHTGTLLGTGIYTNASGVTGLQYIKTDRLYSSIANGNFVAKWEDIEFYNNTTSITTPATWTYPPDIGQIAQLSGSDSANSYTAASEFYTISTDVWDSAFNLSGGGRARAGSAGSTEHAYLLGGQDGSSYYTTIDKVAWADKTNTTITRSARAWGGAVQNAVSVCVGQSYYSGSYQTGINEYTYGTMAETSQGNTSSSHAFGGSFGNSTYGFVVNGQNTGIERYTYSDKSKTSSGFTASPTTTNSGGHTGNSTTGISINNTAGSGNARYDSYNISADTWTTGSATSSTPYENGRASGSTKYDLFSTQTNTGTARQCEKYNYSSGALSSFTSVATNLDGGDQDAGASSTNTGVNS